MPLGALGRMLGLRLLGYFCGMGHNPLCCMLRAILQPLYCQKKATFCRTWWQTG